MIIILTFETLLHRWSLLYFYDVKINNYYVMTIIVIIIIVMITIIYPKFTKGLVNS